MNAFRFFFVRFFSLLTILLAVGLAVSAQANRASIKGTVTDPTKGMMAGVNVIARNVDTNVVSSATTNDEGLYLIPNLPPGTYALTFRKTGFKEITQPSVTLISTQVAGIDVTMQLGSASESITVSAQAPMLDTESTTIGTNMSGKVVTDLPLSIYNGGRFVEDFAVALTPGYSPISSPYGAVVNGSQWFTKDYTVDGTTATASIRGDSMETGPSMEAVQELQAETSGLDAASAITNGGVMAFTLKSGTNQFHGTLFGYGHNEFLDANTWNNDFYGKPKAEARAWDYGASFGGPIFKNKLFFFGTFERYTQTDFTLGGPSSFVPTSAMLNGDFSALLDTSSVLGIDGAGNTIYKGAIFDPQTHNVFPGNIIPTTRFSSVAQKINQIYKQDYSPEFPSLLANNQLPQSNSPSQTPNQAVAKLDYDFTKNDRLSGSWVYNNRPRTLVDSGGVWAAGTDDGGPLANARYQLVKSNQFRISESHAFTVNVLNVFNVTYNGYWNGSSPANSSTNWNSELGFGNTGENNFPIVSFGNSINGYGVTSIGNGWQGHSTGATWVTGDTVTWTKGRHTFNFGGEFRAYQVNSHAGSGALDFNFSPLTTGSPDFSTETGFGFATYLLGQVNTASQSTPDDLYGRRKSMAFFAQDSYKLTPKLTITGGLRWQYVLRYHEKYGNWANFDIGQIDPTYGYPGLLTYLNNSGDSFEQKEYWWGFGPQIGFAYSPTPKWVLRGSFGLTLLPANGPYFNGVPNGFAPQVQGTNRSTAPFDWDSGYPGVYTPGSKNIDPSTLYGGLTYVDPHTLMPGFSDAINVGVQYALTPTTRLEVAYVGNMGHHLQDSTLAWNEPSSSTFLKTVNSNPGINPYSSFIYCANKGDAVPYDTYGVSLTGISCPYANFYGPTLASIAPMPQVANWSSSYYYYYLLNYVGMPNAQSFYNSMVIDLVKRSGNNLSFDVNYTLSKQQGDSYSAQTEYNNGYTPVQDFANLSQAAHNLTNYDQTHIIKGYVTYQLPFGNGQKWLSQKSGWINGLVGGWVLNGLVLYASGQPFQVGITNPYWPLWGNFYPNYQPNGFHGPFSPKQYQVNGPPLYYISSSSVATSPIPNDPYSQSLTLGSGPATNGTLRCPGTANESASVLKNFGFGADGRYQLQLRVEFYNLFNRHTYAINGCGGVGPNNVGQGTFGQVIGVNDNPRTGQFGVRFTF